MVVHFPAIPQEALGRFPIGIGTIDLLVPILPLDIQNQVARQEVHPDFSMEASVLVREVPVWWCGDLQEVLAWEAVVPVDKLIRSLDPVSSEGHRVEGT